MMNEGIFSLHLLFLLGATYGAFLIDRTLLQALICLQVVCANLFIVRQMPLLGLTACGGGMYIASSILGLLLLQDFYGKKVAHRTLYLSFGMAAFFLILSQFHLWYTPAATDTAHGFFMALLGRVPYITVASLMAHFVAHYLTLTLQRVLIERVGERGLFIVSNVTMITGQIVDSIIFFTGAFWGIASFEQITQMITVSMAIKTVMVLCGSVLLVFARRMHHE